MNKTTTIQRFFEARATFDEAVIQELFSANAEIYNVNLPVFKGREGVKNYCENFAERVQKCSFNILDILESGSHAYVEWEAELTYRAGITIAGMLIPRPFSFRLRGVNRFDFNGERIQNLRIYHETTTVVNRAREETAK